MLTELQALLTDGDIEDARALVQEMASLWPDDEEVRYWARVLAPPRVTVLRGERGRPLDRERAWLREHSSEYLGCWLAVLDDRLVAADPSLQIVLSTMRQTVETRGAVLYFERPRDN